MELLAFDMTNVAEKKQKECAPDASGLRYPDLEPLHPIQIAAFARMTPTEKHRVFLGLVHCAREISRNSLRTRHPGWKKEQIESALARITLHGHA